MILYFGFEVCSVSQFIGCCKGVRFLFNNAQTDKYWSNRGKKFVSADPEDSLACSAAVMMLSTFDELASEFDTLDSFDSFGGNSFLFDGDLIILQFMGICCHLLCAFAVIYYEHQSSR